MASAGALAISVSLGALAGDWSRIFQVVAVLWGRAGTGFQGEPAREGACEQARCCEGRLGPGA